MESNWEERWHKKSVAIINRDFEFALNDNLLRCLYKSKIQKGVLKNKLFDYSKLYEVIFEYGVDPLQVCISELKKNERKK
jgi:hypothetical protein